MEFAIWMELSINADGSCSPECFQFREPHPRCCSIDSCLDLKSIFIQGLDGKKTLGK